MIFSVIVATCGRPERLAGSLAAIERSIRASGAAHRVIVVDNSPARTAWPVVSEFVRRSSVAAAYLESESRNKSKALNAGIAAAETDWLGFTDDDTLADINWLKNGAAFALTSGFRIFGGRVIPGEPEQPLPRWLKAGRSGRVPRLGGVLVGYGPLAQSGRLSDSDPVPYGANLFVKREVFRDHGGYDNDLWALCGKAALGVEDGEFGVRVRERGEPVGYCHEAVVVHPVHHERAGLASHLRIAYWYGWRDPIVFYRPDRPPIESYRLRLLGSWAWGALGDLWHRDPAGAVYRLEEMARAVGGMISRMSPGYRRRVALDRDRRPGRKDP
jgi:GT2 family glycosyltransferase